MKDKFRRGQRAWALVPVKWERYPGVLDVVEVRVVRKINTPKRLRRDGKYHRVVLESWEVRRVDRGKPGQKPFRVDRDDLCEARHKARFRTVSIMQDHAEMLLRRVGIRVNEIKMDMYPAWPKTRKAKR